MSAAVQVLRLRRDRAIHRAVQKSWQAWVTRRTNFRTYLWEKIPT